MVLLLRKLKRVLRKIIMNKYRKLSKEEVKNIMNCKFEQPPKTVKDHLSKYYPNQASKVTLIVDSDYNDSTYDNTVVGMIVLDKDGTELTPVKGKSIEARTEFIENNKYMLSDSQE